MDKKSSTSIFLDNLNVKSISEKEDYILAEEFKKTPKNTNWNVMGILVGMVLALTAATITISNWITARNIITDYQLDEFQDVDLMGVLSQVNKVEKKKDRVEQDLIILRRDYKQAIKDVEDRYSRDLHILENKNLTEKRFLEEKELIQGLRDRELTNIDDKYIGEISLKEEQYLILQDQIAEFDSDKIEQAKEYENTLANETEKFEIEKKELIDSYEALLNQKEAEFNAKLTSLKEYQSRLENTIKESGLYEKALLIEKYDPIIDPENNKIINILNRELNKKLLIEELREADLLIQEKSVLDAEKYSEVLNNYMEVDTLIKYLKGLPHINGIKSVTNGIETGYINQINTLIDQLIKKEEEINKLNSINSEYIGFYKTINKSLSRKSRSIGGGEGFIVSVDNNSQYFAIMDIYMDIKQNSSAFIYDHNGNRVGDVKLTRDGLLYKINNYNNHELDLFYKIFINRESK